jgi:hypothetical protein
MLGLALVAGIVVGYVWQDWRPPMYCLVEPMLLV